FFSSRRRHTRSKRDWSSDVCSSDLAFELAGLTLLDRVNDVVGEFLTVDVSHASRGIQVEDVVTDGVQEMGLAESGLPVNDQRVISLAGSFGHGHGSGMREAVRRTDDEVFEYIALVETRIGRSVGRSRPVMWPLGPAGDKCFVNLFEVNVVE